MALSCVKCGTVKKIDTRKPQLYPRKTNREGVVVIDDYDAALSGLSTTRITCPKCENRMAYYRMAETGDEESIVEVQIFRCTRCRHTWRETG
jgi:DNA-directed RNA polymerase subunit M